jgi:hypothetical protein
VQRSVRSSCRGVFLGIWMGRGCWRAAAKRDGRDPSVVWGIWRRGALAVGIRWAEMGSWGGNKRRDGTRSKGKYALGGE